MAHIITLTGPSGSGKSTAIDYLISLKNEVFDPVLIPKYTTRKQRNEKEVEAICVEKLPENCDIVYEQYSVRYGLELKTLYDTLAKQSSPIVILNDVRTVEDIRSALGKIVRTVFVFRESPSLDKHRMLANDRGIFDEAEILIRFQKAQSIYRIYIENIHLFDHVILNFGSLGDLKKQLHCIVDGLSENNSWPLS